MKPLALVFDAYGTLYDVHSVIALCERFWHGKGAALSQLWRTKQLEYTWITRSHGLPTSQRSSSSERMLP